MAGMAVSVDTISGDKWRLCVLSPTMSNLIANPSVFSGALATTATLNVVLGTMRRRKEKAGSA